MVRLHTMDKKKFRGFKIIKNRYIVFNRAHFTCLSDDNREKLDEKDLVLRLRLIYRVMIIKLKLRYSNLKKNLKLLMMKTWKITKL